MFFSIIKISHKTSKLIVSSKINTFYSEFLKELKLTILTKKLFNVIHTFLK